MDLKAIKQATLQHRLERVQTRLEILRRVESRFPWIRLAVLVVTILVIYLAFQLLPLALAWVLTLASLAGFVITARRHQQVIDRIARLETFSSMLLSHIARGVLNWDAIPTPSPIPLSGDHPFATDLNITGERSLHQLLDTTISLGGSHLLARWLLEEMPDPQKIALRQEQVSELLDAPAFCNRLELNGMIARPEKTSRWDVSGLVRWLETHDLTGTLRPWLLFLSILAFANISLFLLNTFHLIPPLWIGTLLVYFILQSMRFRETNEVFSEAYTLSSQLSLLRTILTDLETYPYQRSPRLAELTLPLRSGPKRPSHELRRMDAIAAAASLRNNPFLTLALNTLVPWDMFLAYQLERYKRDLRDLLPAWLDCWYELEALVALANFAALNPETIFPVILPLDRQPVFFAEGIGHPLIPDEARVCNDFNIQTLGEITIITGSNMSGKSTFLRTLGISLVLAYAGTRVTAKQMHVLPFRLYTSMNITDSLSDGISFFYAEVSRLKTLLDKLLAPDTFPLFFLIDEIFRGTNNRERQIGSHAYTKSLANQHGVGLISTHDLELSHLAETIPSVHNQYFREDIKGDKMVFDYKIRPGASPTTNALKIMAIAGLPVPDLGK